MRVLIAEPSHTGHRLWYVSMLAQAAAADLHEVTVATTQAAMQSVEYQVHLAGLDARYVVIVEPRLRHFYRRVRRMAKRDKFDLLVVPDGDHAALVEGTGILGSTVPRNILVMRSSGESRTSKAIIKRFLVWRASRRTGVKLMRLVSGLVPLKDLEGDEVADPFPESVPRSEAAPSVEDEGLNLDAEVFWFGVLGAITERKNLPLVAESIAATKLRSVGLVVAGKCEPGVLDTVAFRFDEMENLGQQVRILDRVLSEHELNDLTRQVDCLVLAHSNEGPSGLLLRGVAAGRRIVCAGAASLRRDAQRIEGAKWVPLDAEKLTRTLLEVVAEDPPRPLELHGSGSDFAKRLLRTNQVEQTGSLTRNR